MPDFHLVERAEISPTCCFICETTVGPFIRVGGVKRSRIATADGPISVRGLVYICVGDERANRPGCLLQAARAAGCATPAEARNLANQVAIQQRHVEDVNTELERARAQSPTQLVSLQELIDAGVVSIEPREVPA